MTPCGDLLVATVLWNPTPPASTRCSAATHHYLPSVGIDAFGPYVSKSGDPSTFVWPMEFRAVARFGYYRRHHTSADLSAASNLTTSPEKSNTYCVYKGVVRRTSTMSTSSYEDANLFRVDGLVAVISGGGTGSVLDVCKVKSPY
nr:hypothetical protein CFP56_28855 [Quercus suber]